MHVCVCVWGSTDRSWEASDVEAIPDYDPIGNL